LSVAKSISGHRYGLDSHRWEVRLRRPGQDSAGDVDHLKIFGTGQRGNVSGLGSDIIDNRRFDPRDLIVS
jgi:hypothetical protein